MFATILITCAVLYFAPTLIAVLGGKRNGFAIFALNLLGGWTALGWLVALVWALTREPVAQIAGGPFPAVSEHLEATADPSGAARTQLIYGGAILFIVMIGIIALQ